MVDGDLVTRKIALIVDDLAYPGSAEETILTEIVANALDSGADCP